MGRREQKKKRERKRAAASCQMLERFLSEKSKTGEVSSELNDSSGQNEMQPHYRLLPLRTLTPPVQVTVSLILCDTVNIEWVFAKLSSAHVYLKTVSVEFLFFLKFDFVLKPSLYGLTLKVLSQSSIVA